MKNLLLSPLSLCSLVVLAVFSLWYHSQETAKRNSYEAQLFRSYNLRNVDALKSNLEQKKNLLDAHVGFFAASKQVEADEFYSFSASLGLIERGFQLCWASTKTKAFYVLNPKLKTLCENLNVLDRSNVIVDNKKKSWVLLSEFTKSSSGKQKGVIFLFFPISELSETSEWNHSAYADTIVVNNNISNKTFRIFKQNELNANSEDLAFYQKIYSLGPFSFFYNSQKIQDPRFKSEQLQTFLVALLFFLAGWVTTLFLQALLSKNSEIQQTVALRTSELHSTNTRLKKANEELNLFAYRTSHDLKAPLLSSKRLVHFILADIEKGNIVEAKKGLTWIGDLMSQLDTLVDDILSLVRSDGDHEEASQVPLSEVMTEIQSKLKVLSQDNQCKIIDDSQDLRPIIQKIRLQQILENLISNSLKYRDSAKNPAFVKVRAWQEKANLVIEVEDNGLGIPEDRHGELFSMFKRFHPQISFGSGLGMSLVKKHMERLKGKISFTTSNQGTTFTLKIPEAFKELP